LTNHQEKSDGFVSLVGAGPGDPGLITAKGLARLREAQVVVFDALANPRLLDEAPTDAQRIDVGKRARAHKLTQDQTNQLLVDLAKQGLRVVRLKGGDPYLFGRGAEEAAYLAQHGVVCEVVPGVTAGIAAPAMAGIPVTHRKLASTVTFVTGHEEPGKDESAIDDAALAALIQSGGTVCFYMGVGRLPSISASLMARGLGPATPAAVVQWGTRPYQRSVRGTLATISQDVANAGIGAPAIIVVGPVAGIDEPGLDYFTNRPLFGQRIVVTRTRQQVSELRHLLEELGAQVLEAPTIELVPPQDWSAVDDAIRRVHDYQWLVLTSINGVEALAQRMDHLGLDARHFAGVKIAAIGDATEQSLRQLLGLRADLVPTRFVAESLAGELIAQQNVKGVKFLLLRADIARPALPTLLQQAGAIITELTIYRTQLAAALPDDLVQAFRDGQVDWVTFTSSSTARNLVELLGPDATALGKARIASIGPITTQTVRELGYEVALEATVSNVKGLVEALVAAGVKKA
jgi:uroporphyrinogen III methyltransferase/synthase